MSRALAIVLFLIAMSMPAIAHPGDSAAGTVPPGLLTATPYRTTEHFRFFGDDEVKPILDRLTDVAEDHFLRMCTPIGACDRVTRPIDIWVAEDAEGFAAGFPDGNPMAEWAAGVTFLAQQRVILRAHGSALMTLMETFDHELAHVLAHTFTQGDGVSVPRWFHEGLAIWLSGEAIIERLQTALQAASSGHLLTYDELARAFPNQGKRVEIGYAQSALFVKRMVAEQGPGAVIGLLQDTGRGIDFSTAFETRFLEPPADMFSRLGDDLEKSTSPFLFLHDGNFLWGLMTVLFVGVAWLRLKDRKRQMARIADSEDQRIADEDMALLAERTRAANIVVAHPVELDDDGKPMLH